MIDLSKFRFRIGDTIEYKGNHYKVMAYYFAEDVNNFVRVYGYTINYPVHNGSDHSFNERGEHMCFDDSSVYYVDERSVNPVKKSIMTKEEAIKFLSNTKVYVDGKSNEIKEKLFGMGIYWAGGEEKKFFEYPFLYINEDKIMTCGNDMKYFKNSSFSEIKADDILSIKIDEKQPQFKPFDRVLVRDRDEEVWRAGVFSHIDENDKILPFFTVNSRWRQCIPYEGNETLVGTNKSPDER